jgi:uncharacterized membrane protein YqiK
VAAQRAAEQEKIAAEVEAYKKKIEAEAAAAAQVAAAGGAAEAVKIRAKAEADASEMQAASITKLAEAHREAGLKEAEVLRQKNAAANSKSRELLFQEAVLTLIQSAPDMLRELVKPAEKIAEIKVLQVGGAGGASGSNGNGAQAQFPLLGNALGPVTKSIIEASAMLPMLKEVMKFTDADKIKAAFGAVGDGSAPAVVMAPPPAGQVPPPVVTRAGQVTRVDNDV